MRYKTSKPKRFIIVGLALALCACTQSDESDTQTPEPAAAQPAELTRQEPATFAIHAVYYTPDGQVIETADTPLLLPDNVIFLKRANSQAELEGEGLYVITPPAVDQDCFTHVKAKRPDGLSYNHPALLFSFNLACSQAFHEFTKENLGQLFAASINGTLVSTPRIAVPIASGSGLIEGDLTYEEVKALARSFQRQIKERRKQ